jgi:hypothetical protein
VLDRSSLSATITNVIALDVLNAVAKLLASKPAVVLERIARGGGATNWFFCRGPPRLLR